MIEEESVEQKLCRAINLGTDECYSCEHRYECHTKNKPKAYIVSRVISMSYVVIADSEEEAVEAVFDDPDGNAKIVDDKAHHSEANVVDENDAEDWRDAIESMLKWG